MMKKEYLINAVIGFGFVLVIILLLGSILPETPEQRQHREEVIEQQRSHELERTCIRKKGHPVMVNNRVVDCEGYQGFGLNLKFHHE